LSVTQSPLRRSTRNSDFRNPMRVFMGLPAG
jgi:hypothetical protein